MNITSKTIIGGLILIVAALLYTLIRSGDSSILGATSIDSYSIMTPAIVSVDGTVDAVFTANANAKHREIWNLSANKVYCVKEGATAAASSVASSTGGAEQGFILAASSTADSTNHWISNGYTGNINCTASAASRLYTETD